MNALKPCPFCGREAVLVTKHHYLAYFVECANEQCFASVRGDSELEVLLAWNNRQIEDELRKRIAELEAESERFTVHSDIERQDDKSPNDTQTQTIVYGKEREE